MDDLTIFFWCIGGLFVAVLIVCIIGILTAKRYAYPNNSINTINLVDFRNTDMINNIRQSLDDGSYISQLTYRQLFIDLLEIIEEDKNLDDSMERFRLWISLEYDDNEQMIRNKDNAFDFGVCWAVSAILEQHNRNKLDKIKQTDREQLVRKHKKIFKIILDNPGISQNELYEKIKKLHKSDIYYSQFLSIISNDPSLVRILNTGINKYFWLTTNAEKLLFLCQTE